MLSVDSVAQGLLSQPAGKAPPLACSQDRHHRESVKSTAFKVPLHILQHILQIINYLLNKTQWLYF